MRNLNNKGIAPIVIILIVAGVLALAGGGWYVYQNSKIKVQNEASEQNQQAVNQDETANWKTYRNEQYGFEFKYPQEWMIKERNNPSMPSGFYISEGMPSLQISFGPNASEKVFEFGCLKETKPSYAFFDKLSNGGLQINDGKNESIDFGDLNIVVKGISPDDYDHLPGIVWQGTDFGYEVHQCNQNDVCAIFYGYGNGIKDLDKLILQSFRFSKDFDQWNKTQCKGMSAG